MADDIFQESFYRFLKAKPVIFDDNHMKSYLYKIAFRLIVDKRRRIKVEKRAFEEEKRVYEGSVYKEGRESGISLSLDMEKTFHSLKAQKKILLWLAYAEGYSCKEIAEITDAKEKTVKVQLFRARRELANILQQKEYREGKEP